MIENELNINILMFKKKEKKRKGGKKEALCIGLLR